MVVNETDDVGAVASLKLTVPEPLIRDHCAAATLPKGRWSSSTKPSSRTEFPTATNFGSPAVRAGGKLPAFSRPGEGPEGLARQARGSSPTVLGPMRSSEAPLPSASCGHGNRSSYAIRSIVTAPCNPLVV